MAKLTVSDLELSGKKVLMRVDFNVPIKAGVIGNDNRIVAALPTIKYVLENNGRAILFSHLGRIKSEDDKKELSLAPVAARLGELLGKDVKFVPQTRGEELESAINALQDGEVLMVENTRFEDVVDGEVVKNESKNNPELGKYWASLGDDLFINDAFGTAHRAHASNVGIASNVSQAAAGFLMEKEIKFLGDAVANPVRPFVAIIGGAKVSDKIEIVKSLLNKADKVIVGGGMAYTFDAAKGNKIGNSLFEADKVELAKELMAEAGDKLVLPIDSIAADAFSNDAKTEVVDAEDGIPDGYMGLDIGPKSVKLLQDTLSDAKTVVWNGPMGVFEMSNFAKGTLAIGEELVKVTENGGTTIVGGGDSTAAVQQLGVADKLTHISTGGGASLEYLEGKELPGIASISEK
ncbi:MAG: phosphoglycerate kinase [Leuconostoc mesenteroides]|jgi:phosphoglycerate kinase|uniref:Phosphoglycerate kinase n=2 Tax=Leuconostoc mesenteroides TaxID=1245 RepID=PGK_LEUMM|nr:MULTISPECIES: phosphoglycerate kinase [Leuconostoc]Q03UX8.1 RecName: Full=Phosphoglycerate kinase [Leuconostoc mesenteroides subsp. mesenteroides ATCC 8293]ABJ62994.1 phosphoglycerate kinase [Leuconostoc mesenteroides subsp. mesenteroides ATCC 8293]ARN64318.1 phosphoglycerate kinase [Leuconostoc mesenteroides subsp. mesenteroides]KAA8349017.1 phosphoglycerate kinase [Leuconostoc mesenteroides]KAA8370050.1 phosphoglycerate kinase [Leuconostoc mesenteroides]KAA8380565.1 phosphoglycerate kina